MIEFPYHKDSIEEHRLEIPFIMMKSIIQSQYSRTWLLSLLILPQMQVNASTKDTKRVLLQLLYDL